MWRSAHRVGERRGSRARRSSSFRSRSRSAPRLRLWIEALEDRLMLAADTWINPAGGDWATSSNWSSGALPGPGDDAVINALNPGAIVTHSQNVTDTIHSLAAAAPITLSGGELDLSGGTSTAGLLSDSSPFSLAGGNLSLADVQAGTAVLATNHGGTLDGVTLGGTLTVSGGAITIAGGLTLAGGAVADVGGASGGEVDFLGDQTIGGSGAFDFAGSAGTLKLEGHVTFGPGVTVHGESGNLLITSGSLLNQGTIASDGGGTIAIDGGAATSWSNAAGGSLEANGGTLTLDDAWSSAGQIVVNNSTLNLGGTFTTASLGSLLRTGGTVNLAGALDNSGATLVLDAATGSFNLTSGTLKGGALATLDDTSLASTLGSGTLDGVTLGATVAGQAQPGTVVVATGLSVIDGLTLTADGAVQIGRPSGGEVDLLGDQTIGGPAPSSSRARVGR